MTKFVHSRVIDTKPSRPADPCPTAFVVRSNPSNPSSPNPWKHQFVSRYQVKSDPSGDLGLQLNMLV